MNSREKILAMGVAVVVALFGVKSAYDYVSNLFFQQENRLDAITKAVSDKELEIAKGAKATRMMAQWRQQSLPQDAASAATQYQTWLVEIAEEKAGMSNVVLTKSDRVRQVSAAPRVGRGRATAPPYESLGFEVKAQATLPQIVRMLYEFYRVSQLHRITDLSILKSGNGDKLDLECTIEALIVAGGNPSNELNREPSDRLALGELKKYEDTIVERNLFAEYVPPPPPRDTRPVVRNDPPPPPPPPRFDQAKFATVTGIVEQNNEPQLWVHVKTTGELLKLSVGEEFSIGDLKCKVVRIGVRDAELASGDEQFQVRLQDNLRDAARAASREL